MAGIDTFIQAAVLPKKKAVKETTVSKTMKQGQDKIIHTMVRAKGQQRGRKG